MLVQGLAAKPEHNGKEGRILSWDSEKERFGVHLDSGEKLSLRLANVQEKEAVSKAEQKAKEKSMFAQAVPIFQLPLLRSPCSPSVPTAKCSIPWLSSWQMISKPGALSAKELPRWTGGSPRRRADKGVATPSLPLGKVRPLPEPCP